MSGDQNGDSIDAAQPIGPNQTSISLVANPQLLKTVWKRHIRKVLRSARLRDFCLAQDPVQFAAYEWGLATFLVGLSADLMNGSYTPEPAVIIRGAKSAGLSRPLALLSPRDALVYRTIVLRAEPDLKRDLRKWTGATMDDRDRLARLVRERREEEAATAESGSWQAIADEVQGRAGPNEADEQGDDTNHAGTKGRRPSVMETESYSDDWFQIWISKQGIVANICDSCPYVVESDVANFFTAVDLEVVREHLHSHTSLDKETVRLCISLIRRILPHPGYADSPTMGLPQESFDSSRAIAHSLLVAVDRLFDAEGRNLLYSRFMDDFVIGAGSIDEGERIVSRIQDGLEPLGLYPNTAKTRVVTTEQFLEDAMTEENVWLEEVESRLADMEAGSLRRIDAPADLVDEVVSRFVLHRGLEARPKRWDRVLRRFYTVLRRLGVGDFIAEALDDLGSLPSSVAHLLEYIRSFPLRPETAAQLCQHASNVMDLYGDVPLLSLEAIGSSPNDLGADDRAALTAALWDLVRDERMYEGTHEGALPDRIVAAAIPVLAKFGTTEDHLAVVELITERYEPKSHARIQAEVLVAGLGLDDQRLTGQALPGLPWPDVLALRFLDALSAGDEQAVGVALNLLSPQIRLLPNRYHVHTRPLMFLPILRRSAPARIAGSAESAVALLGRNPRRLWDRRGQELFVL